MIDPSVVKEDDKKRAYFFTIAGDGAEVAGGPLSVPFAVGVGLRDDVPLTVGMELWGVVDLLKSVGTEDPASAGLFEGLCPGLANEGPLDGDVEGKSESCDELPPMIGDLLVLLKTEGAPVPFNSDGAVDGAMDGTSDTADGVLVVLRFVGAVGSLVAFAAVGTRVTLEFLAVGPVEEAGGSETEMEGVAVRDGAELGTSDSNEGAMGTFVVPLTAFEGRLVFVRFTTVGDGALVGLGAAVVGMGERDMVLGFLEAPLMVGDTVPDGIRVGFGLPVGTFGAGEIAGRCVFVPATVGWGDNPDVGAMGAAIGALVMGRLKMLAFRGGRSMCRFSALRVSSVFKASSVCCNHRNI